MPGPEMILGAADALRPTPGQREQLEALKARVRPGVEEHKQAAHDAAAGRLDPPVTAAPRQRVVRPRGPRPEPRSSSPRPAPALYIGIWTRRPPARFQEITADP